MGKQLIIAEKPSVAADIAKALGGFSKEKDYFENTDFIVSSAVGHLLEIAMPEEEEVKRGKWSFANLPAIPSHFELNPIEKTADRLKVLTKLIKRNDVDALINACDAGREGELIFRYIVAHSKTKKPVQRLWLQSMTPQAIRQGFSKLKSGEELQPLADAAMCRSESDWLIGINGTRAMTAFNSKSGGFQLTTVGRVQTPTLAVLVEREDKIRRFVSKVFWTLEADFLTPEGNHYLGKWFNPDWKKNEADPDAKADRLWTLEQADAIQQACLNQPAHVEEESKAQQQQAPLLFDLTSLQREANQKFGFSAKTTLGLAQSLYEKHKAITYPRTDARALPEDYINTVTETFQQLQHYGHWETLVKPILNQYGIRPNKRIFDNSKISDHFAIIPTPQLPKTLNELETKLYELIAKRFMAIFYPAAEFLQTTRISRINNLHHFKSEGKILVKPGWLMVYGREAQDDDAVLCPVDTKKPVQTDSIEVNEQATKPPARFTEATLLSAMEGAGKHIDDEELKAAIKEKGLGTPATRATIIEGLLNEKYVIREARDLIPTAKASSLITLLRGLGIPEMFSPELTAEWEYKLAQIERGELSRPTFMQGIVEMTQRIVGKAKNYDSDTVPGEYAVLKTPCPECKGEVRENYKRFQCQSCSFGFWKIIGGRQLDVEEAETLIQEKRIGPLEGFRSRLGRAFSATLLLKDSGLEFDFGDPTQSDTPAEPVSSESLGPCPKCTHDVYEYDNAYYCSQTLQKKCDFRFSKIVLQRSIDRETIHALLHKKRTPLLDRFISSRTKRAFSAHLILKDDASMGFEFAAKATDEKAEGTAEKPVRKKSTTTKTATKRTKSV
ncbi:MAG: DNA topoisomerase III [Pseudomonadota bacterium]